MAAGVVGNYVYDFMGPVGPFDVSAMLLCAALIIITLRWPENYGNAEVDFFVSLHDAFAKMKTDHRIVALGLAQSLFEGAMFIFVFLWTPSLHEVSAPVQVHI